jgi:predicted nucleic acid-binding protein
MGWIEDLHGQTVGVDTAPFIYFVEEHPSYLEPMRGFFSSVGAGRIKAVTSTVTLLEVLVQPFRRAAGDLARQYRDIILSSDGLSCVDLSSEIAENAARLRAQYNLRTPDAIQLATAIRSGASSFLTNDKFLPSISSIRLLILDNLV